MDYTIEQPVKGIVIVRKILEDEMQLALIDLIVRNGGLKMIKVMEF